MNKQFINNFLLGDAKLEITDSQKIREMMKVFPYCETIRKIDLLIKKKEENVTFGETLPKVAMYSSNRKNLFLFLLRGTNPTLFNQISVSKNPNFSHKKQTFNNWLQHKNLDFNKPSTNDKKTKITFNSLSQNNRESTDDLMTETLAKLYLEQNHFNQAIKAYKILCLKYPKKSSLFASEIKKITKLKLMNESC